MATYTLAYPGDTVQWLLDKINSLNYYTRPQVLELLEQYARMVEVQSIVASKQDRLVSGTNIKTVDGQSIVGGGNVDLSRFVTATANNLANYYLKSDVYTKAEVQQLISSVQGFAFVSAVALPDPSSLTLNKVYLVPSTNPQSRNIKEEFITIETPQGYAWEQIGSTSIDLSGYPTTAEMNAAISSALSTVYTKSEVDTLLANIDLSEYMPKSGGTMTGQLKWQNENALPKATSLSYLLGIDSFSNGGTTKYISFADLAASLVTPLTSTNLTKEAYLQWGGRNFTASYGPIDAAMVSELGACRTMFAKAAGIVVEYSTDGGETWLDYGLTDSQKVGLFSSGQSVSTGKNTTAGGASPDNMLRVSLRTKNAGIYTSLNKFVLYVNTNGSSGSYCTIRCRTQQNYEDNVDTWVVRADHVGIGGWSGWNVINITATTTYGNTKASQYGEWQFIFGYTGASASYAGLIINKIFGFGGVGWTTPSNMAATGHLYSFDASQAAYFPNLVRATKLVTQGGTSSQFVKGDGSLDSTAYQVALVSGTNIKTINNESLLGAGNLTISNGVDGKSAYQLWLDEGNTGTIQDFFDSLQGNSGYSGDISELEIVNNLSDGGATAALSAQQGVVLDGKITALKNSIVFLTESEYENLVNPDPTKIYMTYES